MTYHPGKEVSELVEFSGVCVLWIIYLENCPMETFSQTAPLPPKTVHTYLYILGVYLAKKIFILEKKYYASFFFDDEK